MLKTVLESVFYVLSCGYNFTTINCRFWRWHQSETANFCIFHILKQGLWILISPLILKIQKSLTPFWKAYTNSYLVVINFLTQHAVFGGKLSNQPFLFFVITFVVSELGKHEIYFWKSQMKCKRSGWILWTILAVICR